LTATIQKLSADKSAADAKARDADSTLAQLREQAQKADTDAKAARDALAKASAAGKQAATFAAAVAQRVQAAPGTAATDLLAALDRALARPAGESVAAAPTRPSLPVEAVQTPQQVQQAHHAGYTALRTGDAGGAEREFARLTASPERTAIHYYLLGLAQWHQSHYTDAEDSFHRGWALEKESKPPPAEVEKAFERLDRGDRKVINDYRR